MSSECQLMGSDNCGIGKECSNENCDYKICNNCAEKLLKYNNNNFFDTFDCPACTRTVVYRFNSSRSLSRKIKLCGKNLWECISPLVFIFSILWAAICWGRFISYVLGHIGYWTNDKEFFCENFLIYSILGWIAFCLLILLLIIFVTACTFMLACVIIICEAIYIEYVNVHYRSVLID